MKYAICYLINLLDNIMVMNAVNTCKTNLIAHCQDYYYFFYFILFFFTEHGSNWCDAFARLLSKRFVWIMVWQELENPVIRIEKLHYCRSGVMVVWFWCLPSSLHCGNMFWFVKHACMGLKPCTGMQKVRTKWNKTIAIVDYLLFNN